MDRLNNGLYISIGGTLTAMGLYAGYRQRKERRERGGDLPTVNFDYFIGGSLLEVPAEGPDDISALLS